MVIIRDHHLGDPAVRDNWYRPTCDWPERCIVQWGSKGYVIRGTESYTTAFFEAFPADGDNAGGFLRGEGETLAEAEEACFRRYQKEVACTHRWGRKGYLNGGALCHVCGAFEVRFKPVVLLQQHRVPLERMEADSLESGWMNRTEDGRKWLNLLRIRAKLFGVKPRRQP